MDLETRKNKKVWKRPEVSDEVSNPLHYASKSANDAFRAKETSPLKNPNNRLQIRVELDGHNRPKAEHWARITTAEGVSVAEVWGTKSGKARSYIVAPAGELDKEGEEQLAKALPIARHAVTKKKEFALADDSGPESGSDNSSDEEL